VIAIMFCCLVGNLVGGFMAGWVVGRYGEPARRTPRDLMPRRVHAVNPKYLAAELARSNTLEIR
jgi:membrane protein YqaA with SNARE-associated domain